MSVKFTHPEYDKYLPKWKRCRDVAEGQDAIHGAGELYLPKLTDQTDADYKAYKCRATFYNATWRTISGLVGMLFRKPPTVEVPAVAEETLVAVTADGKSLQILANEVAEECLIVGRVGVMVDYPVVNDYSSLTLADAQVLNLRPTLALYKTEDIINWKISVVNNRRILTMVVLVEQVELQIDEFENKCELQYRVLDLFNGKYRVRRFVFDEKDEQVQIGEDFFPLLGNQPMGFIPFYVLSTDDLEICPDEPPLIDLVDMNLAHYRTTADYEHGCHFTGLPTGYITGHVKEPGEEIYLGSQQMLIFPNPETQVGFLEFSGAGLGALERNLERKEAQMAVIGARMLEQQKRAAEAAETAAIHRSGENSLLANIAQSISIGLTRALQTFCDWAGGQEEVWFDLNRDFFPMPMDPEQLTVLVTSWQSGAISKETLFENLKRGEIIAPTRSFEDEETKIANSMPLTPTVEV